MQAGVVPHSLEISYFCDYVMVSYPQHEHTFPMSHARMQETDQHESLRD